MEPIGIGDLLAMLASFLVVIGLLVVTLFGIRKYGSGITLSGDRHINVLEIRNLGARSKLLLLQIRDEQLLVGVTATNISKLAHWPVDQNGLVGQDMATDSLSHDGASKGE